MSDETMERSERLGRGSEAIKGAIEQRRAAYRKYEFGPGAALPELLAAIHVYTPSLKTREYWAAERMGRAKG